MNCSLSWLDRARRVLVEQIDRLRQALAYLGQRLRESIAGEIGHAVAGAVREGVRALLECDGMDMGSRRPSTPPVRSQAMWHNPNQRAWSDDLDDSRFQDEWDDRSWDEPEEVLSTQPSSQPVPGRSTRVRTLVCQVLLWWLKQWSSWPMLGAGVMTGVAAWVHHPLLTSAVAAFALVASLIALSDAAQSSAAVLAETISP